MRAIRFVAAVILVGALGACESRSVTMPGTVTPEVLGPDAAKFKLLNEQVYDVPIKTQVVQHVMALGVPTEEELCREIVARYHTVKRRTGGTPGDGGDEHSSAETIVALGRG